MQAFIIASHQEDRDFLGFILQRSGLAVAKSADIEYVLSALAEHPVDLILLAKNDHKLLLVDAQAIREVTQVPLLVLVESLVESQHCELLDAGADLVWQRPISPRVLSRYVHIFLRRAANIPTTVLPTLGTDEITLDPAARTVTVAGQEAQRLTPLEFRLLYVLMTNAGQVIPVETIVERVWGYSGEGNRELVRGLVRRLRRKIEPDFNKPRFIQNLPGVGYRFSTAD